MKHFYTTPQLIVEFVSERDVLIASNIGDNDTSWNSEWNGSIGG